MSRRVLPTPASPASRTEPLAEPAPGASPTAALSRLSSWLRPTSGLTEAVGTASIIVPSTDNDLRLYGVLRVLRGPRAGNRRCGLREGPRDPGCGALSAL